VVDKTYITCGWLIGWEVFYQQYFCFLTEVSFTLTSDKETRAPILNTNKLTPIRKASYKFIKNWKEALEVLINLNKHGYTSIIWKGCNQVINLWKRPLQTFRDSEESRWDRTDELLTLLKIYFCGRAIIYICSKQQPCQWLAMIIRGKWTVICWTQLIQSTSPNL
jgi:hypothetical protein